ncbi:hypothetical protein SETIT_4G200500v2 [Setaria italica]|uniref:DUF834 domain-containing protein n=1 Tax=Setaria italica TaxID=4555 RepID=A0A368QW50_SETIT|nr:hypothetical protein SETIT_4G200500v2 [Setaria italica]
MVGFAMGCCNRTGAHHGRRARVQGRGSGGGHRDGPPRPTSRSAPLLPDEHERKEGARCPSMAQATTTTASTGTCGDGASGVVRDLAGLEEVLEGVEGSRGGAQEDEDAMCGELLPLMASSARRRRRVTRTPPKCRRRRRPRARERSRMTRAPARRRHPCPRSREATASGGGAAFLRDSRGTPIVRGRTAGLARRRLGGGVHV